MIDPLPEEVQTIELPDGVRYCLPVRPLGLFRLLGPVSLFFGLLFCGFAVTWIILALGTTWKGFTDATSWIGLGFALIGVPIALCGLYAVAMGLFLLAGHSEIELSDGMISAIERCGPLCWKWTRPVAGLRGFIVTEPVRPSRHRDQALTFGNLGAICPDWQPDSAQKTIYLAPGYPRPLQIALARALAGLCQVSGEGSNAPSVLEVVTVAALDTSIVDVLDQPADSPVVVEMSASSLTLTVPPLGVWRGGKPFFLFGLIWCSIFTLLTVLLIFVGPNNPKFDDTAMVGSLACLGLFELVGLAMLLVGVHLGRRRAVLRVVDDELQIFRAGLFGSSRRLWTRLEVGDIRVGPSNLVVNDVPVLELQIHPVVRTGQKYGLLGGRDANELRWLATLLRQRLLPETPATPGPVADIRLLPFQELDDQPDSSDIELEESTDGLTLRVPPPGIWRGNKSGLRAGIVWLGIMSVAAYYLIFSDALRLELPLRAFIGFFGFFFWGAGFIPIGQAVYLGRHSALLALDRDELRVEQTSLFGSWRHRWRRAELADVAVGMGTVPVSGQPMLELKVLPRGDVPVGLLTGRDAAELEWLATVLRGALGMRAWSDLR